MTAQSKLAMSSDFLEAFAQLPRPQQRGVRSLITKFNTDSTARGLNYEPIRGAERRMRSLRIDQAYRAIVLKPKHGKVHLLLWAAKHDDAYDWAGRHHCRINPETGALQVYAPEVVADAGPTEESSDSEPKPPRPFDTLRDRELARLGVPPAMVPEVRSVHDDRDLDAMQVRLPVEAYESLFLYLAGDAYDDLVRQRETLDDPVDPDDFAEALRRIDSRSRFVVVDDEMELEEVLNAPLEKWRVFLHPSQRRLVERRWNGPVRVLGGAGTGKTVAAMHRARWLARNLPERGRVLFVTFTRNLAADIANNLRSICTPEEMGRIEVTNLDRWVNHFLRRRSYDQRIIFRRHRDAWGEALAAKDPDLGLPDAFYSDEWEQVILANGVSTEAEYLRAVRTGRGTPLHRAVRAKVWPVFETYRLRLTVLGLKEVDDAYGDAAALLVEKPSSLGYATVVVDEAQDMGSQAYRLIRQIVPEGRDDLFIVGDGHQRIFGRNKVVLGRCGINIRGRGRKLRLNYRTTEETRDWAVRLLADRRIDDLDGGRDDNRGFKSLTHGPRPQLVALESKEQQAAFVVRYLRGLLDRGAVLRGVCTVARTRAERDFLAEALMDADIEVTVLEADNPDEARDEGVRLATMHRVKGLEFDRVVIASVNDNLVPLPAALAGYADETALESAETEERALVYVAATRAKKELLVLSYGEGSRFLEG